MKYKFGLLTPWPWETDIEPDIANDVASIWVERDFTRSLHHDKDDKIIKALVTSYVGLCRFASGESEWIIADENGVYEATTRLETLFGYMDKWKLVHVFK